MPYVACPHCGHRTFSVAYWSNREHCGACGRELPSPRTAGAEQDQQAFPQPRAQPLSRRSEQPSK
ncbi:hypothetical protein [Conexibacter woesei]|uniref:Uncharacterized protein n=1 Tax=Conexibacter woesei (strain DSM 14684 / CCUG 47730 / CIP 108061 / JCM 11494 / NBRC 100937 / ID131577) TaxID=469383 RepID=D3FC44_CONWI|nr:hypothetical protein [Conexibacter woesei]ADB53339.1 hypothetical protein Cwoe_4927 [Conexibacter woesei DSM 14684]